MHILFNQDYHLTIRLNSGGSFNQVIGQLHGIGRAQRQVP